MFGQRFDDGADVADVHRLVQQQLQHFLEYGDGDHFGDDFLDQFGCQLGHMINQLLGLGAAQQTRGLHLHQV
jgi:hypothetical protein